METVEQHTGNGTIESIENHQNASVIEKEEIIQALNGPDQILAADKTVSVKRDGAVKLRISDNGPSSRKPYSLVTLLNSAVQRMPNHNALAYKQDQKWNYITYRQYLDEVRTVAKAFIKLGLEEFNGVGIIGFNSPEWFISDLAAIYAGGLAVGVYTTNSPEACQYVCHHAQCNIIVVENDQQLQKILKVRNELPYLKAIIQYRGKPTASDVYSWDQLKEIGRVEDELELNERIKRIAVNRCSTLIYTSGTTGSPKGVMLSHDNCTWTAEMLKMESRLSCGTEHLISYLPLSHIAAQVVDIYMPLILNATVYFAQPDALKGSLVVTLREVRPTAFLGVPRVWEKIQEKMIEVGKGITGLKRKLADWAKDVGYRGSIAKMNGAIKPGSKMKRSSYPYGWSIANFLVFKNIKKNLGLDRCQFCLTAAAPITMDTLDFFYKLDLPIFEVYGMSECTGPHTVSMPWRFKKGSVGSNLVGVDTNIEKTEGGPDSESGEICMKGRHVMMGYLNAEEKTSEAIDSNDWLHTGDIGRFDKNNFLYITGRSKELIITAGGENVAPVPIEDSVKEVLPVVSNCMLIGDKRKFLSMLITLKTDVDSEGTPQETLSSPSLDWCKSVGSSAKTVRDVTQNQDEHVLKGIQIGIDKVNAKSVSRAQKIQKWTVLPRDFSVPGGELGPTLKLRRPIVNKMYAKTIDTFYQD
ncbi:DgyrCDS8527 [Dimorphilus gyrociliatus]|uniref:long-chain-fatty-acid--CoA ligase n=1 Tax=Dimorphilus gyrociliatus TaxID=2664684 RepID=A0A7I8VWM4_9ANNE|nr:DgyrCDS8527 [Dimorphilus gyrociliatus]